MNTSRTASAIALTATLALVWLSLGVGIIGADGDPANLLYFGVVGIGVAGALIARLRPAGMARTLAAMAAAQALIGAVAILAGWGRPASGALELLLLNGFFVAAFLGAAWLFNRAARTSGLRQASA